MKKVVAVVLPLILVAGAWITGLSINADKKRELLDKAFPGYKRVEVSGSNILKVKAPDGREFFVTTGTGNGYGGPVYVAVAADNKGTIGDISVLRHGETPGFIGKVFKEGYPGILKGKNYKSSFEPGEELDGVSGATLSLKAICRGAEKAATTIAVHNGFEDKKVKEVPFNPGVPEFAIALLFFLSWYKNSKKLKKMRYLPYLVSGVSIVVIGFMYNALFSLTGLVSLLSGYVPQWQTHFYWFLMSLVVIGPPLLSGKSTYCSGFCPFGGVQDGMALLGGRRISVPELIESTLTWLKNLLTPGIILGALVLRNPGLAGYEISGTMFSMNGTTLQIGMLVLFLLLSMFIKRPWCRFLCPVGVFNAFLLKCHGLFKRVRAGEKP